MRPARCYRYQKNRPHPKSRFNRSVPDSKIRIFSLGNKTASIFDLPECLNLIVMNKQQISSQALEAARICINKFLVTKIGKDNFHIIIRSYPHHVVRINKMLSCAGADRIQTGMRGAYGKSLCRVARVWVGQPLISVRTTSKGVFDVKEGLRRAMHKFSGVQKIVISDRWGFTDLTKEEFLEHKNNANLWLYMPTRAIPIPVTGPKSVAEERRVLAEEYLRVD